MHWDAPCDDRFVFIPSGPRSGLIRLNDGFPACLRKRILRDAGLFLVSVGQSYEQALEILPKSDIESHWPIELQRKGGALWRIGLIGDRSERCRIVCRKAERLA